MKNNKPVVIIESLEVTPEDRTAGEQPDQAFKGLFTLLGLLQFILAIDQTIESLIITFLSDDVLMSDEARFLIFVYSYLILIFQVGSWISVCYFDDMDVVYYYFSVRVVDKSIIFNIASLYMVCKLN